MGNLNLLYVCLILSFVYINPLNCTHLRGSFKTNEFFKFLIKFGVQKTDRHNKEETRGYIFGNITSPQHFPNPITLAVLNRASFLEYYQSRVIYDKKEACKHMFAKLSTKAFYPKCNNNGQDYLRRIPCPKGELCPDEDLPSNVIKDHQFTYVIQNLNDPSFWYVSMVACYRNETTCEWHHFDHPEEYELHYDIWLVNGNPNTSSFNTLTYQFSFDRQNTLELYLLFWVVYMILVPLQCHAVKIQKHPVTKLFTASLLLDFVALFLILIHTAKFALDGVGFPSLSLAGDIFDILSRVSSSTLKKMFHICLQFVCRHRLCCYCYFLPKVGLLLD